jgi:spermidine/putrescine transport system ATP-binding protein
MSDAGHGLTAQAAFSRPPDGINAVAEADVRLQDVTKRFDNVTAVDRVTLDVYRGEFLSVIGPSGCGKTTTMRLIAGLEQPDAGQILVRGQHMEGVPPYERNVGLVFQSFALFPHLSVIENVEFGLRMRGEAAAQREKKAQRALETVGMGLLAQRKIEQLSGGQKQRVALARALVVEPALILLDEPLGSLDAKLRIEMQSELKSLQRQMGVTFIHVSHNQGEALVMADRIAVMNDGRFEQVGTPQVIYKEPQTRFVAEFVGRNNIFSGRVVSAVDGTARVETRHGTFVVAAPDRSITAGKDVTFVVRADLMRPVMSGAAPPENAISGVIKGLEYAGSVILLVLDLGGSEELKVEQHESFTTGEVAPRHGANLTVSWTAAGAFLLPTA